MELTGARSKGRCASSSVTPAPLYKPAPSHLVPVRRGLRRLEPALLDRGGLPGPGVQRRCLKRRAPLLEVSVVATVSGPRRSWDLSGRRHHIESLVGCDEAD